MSLRLPPSTTIKEILKIYRLNALKKLSQNFLLDPNLCRKFVKVGGGVEGKYVCEVGPGPGSITREILRDGAKYLTVVEKDRRFIPILELLNKSTGQKMNIVRDDIMNFNMSKIFPDNCISSWGDLPPPICIMGNLPFSISTILVIRWLKDISLRKNAWMYGRVPMILTFQKEVAERMEADAFSVQRCRLSVMVQNWCHVRYRFTIPGTAFLPKPDVDVGVVVLTPRVKSYFSSPFDHVEKVTRLIFQHRQKQLSYGIRIMFPGDRPELTLRMIEKSGVNPKWRSYQLDMDQFAALCNEYTNIIEEEPFLYEFNYAGQFTSKLFKIQKSLNPVGFDSSKSYDMLDVDESLVSSHKCDLSKLIMSRKTARKMQEGTTLQMKKILDSKSAAKNDTNS